MGLLGKLLGTEKPNYPPLEASHPGASRIEEKRSTLESFVQKLHDKVEIVPGQQATWAFIGKPPDAFGIAWFEGSEEHNLKRLMAEKKLSTIKVNQISLELAEAYRRSIEAPRYTIQLGGKHVVVTPSNELESELSRIIHQEVEV